MTPIIIIENNDLTAYYIGWKFISLHEIQRVLHIILFLWERSFVYGIFMMGKLINPN